MTDKQPACPQCHRRLCVVTLRLGVMMCNRCRKEFNDPRK